jgi:hypothetical protein
MSEVEYEDPIDYVHPIEGDNNQFTIPVLNPKIDIGGGDEENNSTWIDPRNDFSINSSKDMLNKLDKDDIDIDSIIEAAKELKN